MILPLLTVRSVECPIWVEPNPAISSRWKRARRRDSLQTCSCGPEIPESPEWCSLYASDCRVLARNKRKRITPTLSVSAQFVSRVLTVSTQPKKIQHARVYWGAGPFLVTTKKYEGQARNLLTGTFNQIKPHLRIIHWDDLFRLYQHAREVNEIEKLRL